MEIWNLVFMQFERSTMQPLPRPAVDTGMGLERIAMVLRGVHSTYETDLLRPIIERTIAPAGTDEAHYQAYPAAYRVVADHTRACAFLIADGIVPSNEGCSYVLRRLLRRAAYQGRTIGLSRPFLAQTAEVVIDLMHETYPELRTRRAAILDTLTAEEERFSRTISGGITMLERALSSLPAGEPMAGCVAFKLYDAYGFPLDLTEKIAVERGRTVDRTGFAQAMEQQRQRSCAAGQARRDAR